MRILIQTQLSNYNKAGKFILECDSGWQMMLGRARVMLKLDPTLHIDIMCPYNEDCITPPDQLNGDLLVMYPGRLRFVKHSILANALATRYDFDFEGLGAILNEWTFNNRKKFRYDIVYINDPMLLRNFQALFHITLKYKPKFVTHSHFIDNPSCPKFPVETSLWQGQVEAARKSDWNFWQCESSMDVFFNEMSEEYRKNVLEEVIEKSTPYDDGYSSEEINSPINMANVRIDIDRFKRLTEGKTVLFVPNRIGAPGISSDYTNCGAFMRNTLPELRKLRDDFVVICGNPNQKISNDELETTSGPFGYINVVPDSLNRDEYKWIAKNSHIVVALYNQDSYGGTSSRECIDLGLVPLWLDNYEYEKISYEASWEQSYVGKADLTDLHEKASGLIDYVQHQVHHDALKSLQYVVRKRCSYESTTPKILDILRSLIA